MGMKSQYRSTAARIGTAFMMAGAIFFALPGTAFAEEEFGPGIVLEQKLEAERQAAEAADAQEQNQESQQETTQENLEQTQQESQTGQPPAEIKAVYQGFFFGSGWSEEFADNYECLHSGTYMTALQAGLRGQPEGMTGTIKYQVNVSGYGWQDWRENMAPAGQPDGSAPLEAVKVDLTGQLKDYYDIYYKVYQNGAWTEWAANGNPAGQEGVGLRVDGIRMAVTAKGQTPPEEPERSVPYIDPTRPMVALTFDDGPKASVTDRILNSLEANGGRATFFMVGSNVTAGNTPTIQRMAALNCEVANHTNDHKYLTKLGADGIRSQVLSVNQKIQEACGVTPSLLRPPGGYYDQPSLNVLASMGMPAVMWSIDTRDWQHKNPAKTISSVLEHVKDGDIILMHDIYSTTADAAEVIIPELVKRGYQLVTVSELAAYRGGMAPGHVYNSFRP